VRLLCIYSSVRKVILVRFLVYKSSGIFSKRGDKLKLEVRMSVHHNTIQVIQPTKCNSFTSLLLDVYMWLIMFSGVSPPIIRSIQLH